MCRPPPSSPLFPYTTLFRSDREIGAGGVTAGLGEVPLRDTRGLGPAGGAAGSGAGCVRVGRRSGRAVVVVVPHRRLVGTVGYLLLGGRGGGGCRGGRRGGGTASGPARARTAAARTAATGTGVAGTPAPEGDVRAGVERLRTVRTLPDRVQELPARALRQGAGEGVVAVRRGRVGLRGDRVS